MMAFRIPKGTWKTLSWIPVGIMVTQHCYTLKFITGRSMQPTLNPEPCIWRDLVVFDRLSVHLSQDIRRGDVVVLKSPIEPDKFLVKRIIALEGDVVRTLPPYPEPEVKIPEGHAWIEGDEAFRTLDSNYWGPVPLGLVDAKLAFIVWPPNRMGPLPTPALRNAPLSRIYSQGSTWRKQEADIEQEKWRQARVRESSE